jgi:succinoglycan biosynthesis protein ExoM
MANNLAIDICICTFRRSHIEQTLLSISQMEKEDFWRLTVIVADNDETPSAQALVLKTANETELNIRYVHAPAYNISVARNACLDNATGQILAFLDDDELVTAQWLKELITTQTATGAGMVLGPVRAIYGNACPAWMKEADTHGTMPVWVKGEIVSGYSCNLLLFRNDPAYQNLHFRVDLGKSGGEDTVFCSSYYKAGGRIAFAPKAWVTEVVAENRQTLQWLLKRRFRFGQVHGLMLIESGAGRIKNILLASTKAILCFLAALVFCIKPVRAVFWLLRGALHLGVVSRLMGKRELQLYGEVTLP